MATNPRWEVQMIDSLTGTGFFDEMTIDDLGSIKKSSGADNIMASIKRILTTRLGERVMMPDYGSNIWRYLFEPIDAITKDQIKVAVVDAIRKWEPRIELTKFGIFPYAEMADAGQFKMVLFYRIIGTNTEQQISIPISIIATSFNVYR
jgi:phage baseplate assembly protein W